MNDMMKALSGAGWNVSSDEKTRKDSSLQKNRKQNNDGKNKNGGKTSGYVGAPYNFVPFSSNVKSDDMSSLISHSDMREELFSGEIDYRIEAKTPVCIGDGSAGNHFYKDAYSRFAIPGSSVRGLIRSHAQVLGLSGMADDIDDYSLMYREVAAGSDKKLYNDELGADTIQLDGKSLSILKNVKAGYVECVKKGKYRIYHTKPDVISDSLYDMNYYVVNERHIINEHVKNPSDKSFDFLFHNNRTQHNPDKSVRREERRGRVHWIGEQNKAYKPYYEEISYELQGDRRITAVGKPGEFSHKGFITGTGPMREKKVLYVIPEIDKEISFEISEDDVRAFEIDFENKKNTLGKNSGFFCLPQKPGERRPIFYIQKERLYFGFTPRLRLFNRKTIWDGLPEQQKQEGKIDLVRSMFGFTGKTGRDISYKTKLSFSDAILKNEAGETEKKEVLMGPKPTSYNDYLCMDSDGNAVTYNSSELTLRGMKQYWLRDEKNILSNQGNGNEKVMTTFHPLNTGAIFEGKIRFKNLTEEEMGLLLWCLYLESDCDTNIGMAKPLGFGRIHISVDKVRCLDYKSAYDSTGLSLSPWKVISDVESLIDKYKDGIKSFLGIDDIEKDDSIRSFFEMKRLNQIPDPSIIRYMHLGDKKLGLDDEYKNRRPLPIVDEVVRK